MKIGQKLVKLIDLWCPPQFMLSRAIAVSESGIDLICGTAALPYISIISISYMGIY